MFNDLRHCQAVFQWCCTDAIHRVPLNPHPRNTWWDLLVPSSLVGAERRLHGRNPRLPDGLPAWAAYVLTSRLGGLLTLSSLRVSKLFLKRPRWQMFGALQAAYEPVAYSFLFFFFLPTLKKKSHPQKWFFVCNIFRLQLGGDKGDLHAAVPTA